MRILHISDIHYRIADKDNIERLVSAVCRDVQSLVRNDGAIDMLMFSGDLTYSGTCIDEFRVAYEKTVKLIAAAAGIPETGILFAPGNHDVNRAVVLEDDGIIEAGLLLKLGSRELVNRFVKENVVKGFRGHFLARLDPYYNFISERALPSQSYRDPFVEVHHFEHKSMKYGFALFNSAWRSTGAGESERKKLLISESAVRVALDKLGVCDVLCAMVHHPFEWLADHDRHVVEPTILSAFDAIFQGHVHSSFPEGRVHALGRSLISQAGCLYESQQYQNSFQMVDLDVVKQTATISIRSWYDLPRGEFDRSLMHNETGTVEIPFVPRALSKLTPTQRISALSQPAVYRQACEHVSMSGELNEDFPSVFVCPPLRVKSETAEESNVEKEPSPKESRSLGDE